MAKAASENNNTPAEKDVQDAVADIENCYDKLDTERGIYMSKCKGIRGEMKDHYADASNLGISTKLLKKIIKERELERKIAGLTEDLEADERSEYDMLTDKLGEFANTPLGAAALAKADGKATLAEVGA
jgi:uncharacterized protein (UPF0335 family)